MTQEALKLALEALESCDAAHITDGGHQWHDDKLVDKAITAIKEALAQTQEPIAMLFGSLPVYDRTTPPQRTWVGLTDEDICTFSMWLDDKSDVAVFKAIEAKLKKQNT